MTFILVLMACSLSAYLGWFVSNLSHHNRYKNHVKAYVEEIKDKAIQEYIEGLER